MLSGVFLKVLSDLGFYLSIAGLIGALFGAPDILIFGGWLVLSVAGFLAFLLRNRGVWRFLPFLPAAAYFFFAHYKIAEAAVFLPAFAYVVFLAASKRFEPDQDTERQVFSIFWKLLIVVTLFCLIAKVSQYIAKLAMPIGLITMLCQILLIRGLRHEEEVRNRARYQLSELLLLLVIGGVILFLGSETGVRLIGAGLKAAYSGFIQPLFRLILGAFVFVFTGVAWVMKYVWAWIVELFNLRKPQHVLVEIPPYSTEVKELLIGKQGEDAAPMNVLLVIIGLIVLVILFFVFRWMSKKSKEKREEAYGTVDDRSPEAPVEAAVSSKERSAVAHVRAAYRRYLKLGIAQGVRRQKSDTTLEIQRRYSRFFPDETTGALRELYLRARYDGHADKEDAAQAKELVAQLKKSEQS